jgi:hypothetical protein
MEGQVVHSRGYTWDVFDWREIPPRVATLQQGHADVSKH